MSVTRAAHGVLYHCYRSSCEAHTGGFVPTSGVLMQSNPEPRKSSLRPYYGAFWPLSEQSVHESNWLYDRFELRDPPHVGLNEKGKFVIEVPDPYDRVRGYVVREVRWGDKAPTNEQGEPIAKARVFMHSEGPKQGWYRHLGERIRTVVLVEDAVSAMKVAEVGATGVALLGMDLEESKVREIAQQRPTEVIMALDADATALSFKLARRWGLAWPKVRVALLTRDIKDTPLREIPEVLGL